MSSELKSEENPGVLPDAIEAALFAGLRPQRVDAGRAERIRKMIDAGLDAQDDMVIQRLDEGAWIQRTPDCQIKILSHDRATGLYSFLLRLAANGVVEAHAHSRPEECMILSGEVEVDGLRFGAGDYQLFKPGTRHPRMLSKSGALLFIRAELELQA
ncbi:MAG: cupin domain-containing protein [Nevskia sp.]|nr:cupin domain-containing protein [Nevskia sp.]